MPDSAVTSLSSPPVSGPLPRLGPWALLMNAVVYPLLVLWTLLGMALFSPGSAPLETGHPLAHRAHHAPFHLDLRARLAAAHGPLRPLPAPGFRDSRPSSPVIFVVNHQSFFDTYCMGLLPVFDVTFAVRAWPFRMVWYRWFMRLAGYLDVESTRWEEIESAGRAVLDGGGHLLFFPEGHRSRDGRLQRFYNGAFHVAAASGRPVVPLCLDRHRQAAAAGAALACARPPSP